MPRLPPSLVDTSATPRRARWIFGGFAVLAILALGFEHRMHLSGLAAWLPYLILLACPLMHLFMHRGHGHHGRSGRSDRSDEEEPR